LPARTTNHRADPTDEGAPPLLWVQGNLECTSF
jgi:hypothetical protein